MPVQQLAPSTINEIISELTFYEKQYGISTVDFLAAEECNPDVDEDDAVEWHYRAEQLRVLREIDSTRLYSRAERGASLKNHECLDCLAA